MSTKPESQQLDDEFGRELSAGEDRARRLASLVAFLLDARYPKSTSEIVAALYNGYDKRDSAEKQLRRDAEKLVDLGIPLVHDQAHGTWQLNRHEMADTSVLSAQDAYKLTVLCRPLLADQSFPFKDELAAALRKLGAVFFDGQPQLTNLQLSAPSTAAQQLLKGQLKHCAVDVRYTKADGQSIERRLLPYGSFPLRGQLYVVAASLDEKGQLQPPRTYRLERVQEAQLVDSLFYTVPSDFYAADYCVLPFQLGELSYDVSFAVPAEREEELRTEVGGHAIFVHGDAGIELKAPAADLAACASWAIAQGMRPLTPPELVESWKSLLEGVLA